MSYHLTGRQLLHDNKPIVGPDHMAAGRGGNGSLYHDVRAGVQRERAIQSAILKVLDALLDAEAKRLSTGHQGEHSASPADRRMATDEGMLRAMSGEIASISPGRTKSPAMAIAERFWDREISVEEALIELDVAGHFGQDVDEVTEAAWGARISGSKVSAFVRKVEANIAAWCNRPIENEHPYVYLDSIALSACVANGSLDAALLAAIGIDRKGHRVVLGVQACNRIDEDSWTSFFDNLQKRGLKGVRLVVSDAAGELARTVRAHFPEARWQLCTTAYCREVAAHISGSRARELSSLVRAIHNGTTRKDAQSRARQAASQLAREHLDAAAELVEAGVNDTFSYYAFPKAHWRQIRSASPIERVITEIDRRYKAVGSLPDVNAALLLAAARMRRISSTQWSSKRYLNMQRFDDYEAAMV